ncbi:MAG TPA: methyltransferase domain-containing protein [Candidatus Binataceae bacterium]|nr:methyltransferase domain-containing protein [Candidatus Binataceae bacterium]
MPRKISKEQTHRLAARFDEATDIVANEFAGLDTHQQYRNAFSRVLKWDPLGRVLMLGTDQRDLFVPELRRAILDFVPKAADIFDFGCGDGQTLALAANALPGGARLSFEDPNPDYVDRYRRFIESCGDLEIGTALVAGFDEMDEVARSRKVELPADGSIALGLALHMLYFVADIERCLVRMARFLAPGGGLFIVLADESDGYTGHALRAFIEAGGETGANAHHLHAIAERRRLLAASDMLLESLRHALPDRTHRVCAQRQPSRLYGHSLSDLIALSTIATLATVEHVQKFAMTRRLLEEKPELVDLRIEDDGPRAGMLSVAQPQFVVRVERLRV